MTTDDPTSGIARRLFDALERNDVDRLRDLYDPAVQVWHSTDRAEQTLAQHLAAIDALHTRLDRLSFADRRIDPCDGGFWQRHIVVMQRGGEAAEVAAAVRVTVAQNGFVTRIEEYLDLAPAQPLFATMPLI